MNHNNCWFVVCSVQSFKRHFSVTIVKPDFQKMVKYQATSCIQGSTGLCYATSMFRLVHIYVKMHLRKCPNMRTPLVMLLQCIQYELPCLRANWADGGVLMFSRSNLKWKLFSFLCQSINLCKWLLSILPWGKIGMMQVWRMFPENRNKGYIEEVLIFKLSFN